MLKSNELIILFHCFGYSILIIIITLSLIAFKVIKDIEKRYSTKLGNLFYIKSSLFFGAKYLNVGDYITYLYLVKIGLLKFKEPKYIIPLLYRLSYEIKHESKFNIFTCVLFSITHRFLIIVAVFTGFKTGFFQELYIDFTNSLNPFIFLIIKISLILLLIHLIVTPIIKFKVIKNLELNYQIIINKIPTRTSMICLDISKYIIHKFFEENKIFKRNFYLDDLILSKTSYSTKNETKFNIYMCNTLL
jgi:hypothetical protein